ncbi:hypothetical protein EMIT093MI4_80142 [Pseudomonas sp. IT-93MI4]|jgi:hypothetical protein
MGYEVALKPFNPFTTVKPHSQDLRLLRSRSGINPLTTVVLTDPKSTVFLLESATRRSPGAFFLNPVHPLRG